MEFNIFSTLYPQHISSICYITLTMSNIELSTALPYFLEHVTKSSIGIYIDIDSVPNVLWFDHERHIINRYCHLDVDLRVYDLILDFVCEKWFPEYIYVPGTRVRHPKQYMWFYLLNRIHGLNHQQTIDILPFYGPDDIAHIDDVIYTIDKEQS